MRAGSLAFGLALATVPALTGCLEVLCEGPVVETSTWLGTTIKGPRISAAGDAVLSAWRFEWGNLRTVALADGLLVGTAYDHGEGFFPNQIVSAPAGHLMLSSDSQGLRARTLDAAGEIVAQSVEISSAAPSASAAAFDGERFLVAWTEYSAMKLASIAPGDDHSSAPITIGPGPGPPRPIVMASGGGITWIAWVEEGRALGVRVTSAGPVDRTPVELLRDPRIPARPMSSIAVSGGRFLLAIQSKPDTVLLLRFDGQRNIGTTVEIQGTMGGDLLGVLDGFAFLRDPGDTAGTGTGTWPSRRFGVVWLAPDGQYLRESTFTSTAAALTSDGTRLLHARVHNTAFEDAGNSVFSAGPLAGGWEAEIARTKLQRKTTRACGEPPLDSQPR